MAPHTPLYKKSGVAIDKRVNDLLKRMTLAEKVMQLNAIYKDPIIDGGEKENGVFNPSKAKKVMKHGLGRISAMFRTFHAGVDAEVANQVQRFLLDKTRLGIPVLVDAEGVHGSFCVGSAMFPVSIALGATFNPELVRGIAVAVGREVRARGSHQVFAPVIDLARDLRAGRTQETYGEDPYLVSEMGVAYVEGVQSQRVIATIKHFVANFVGDGGRDSFPIHDSERHMREVHLPPYEACVRAGALSVMSAYHSYDGVPCTANRWLLTDLLRTEWKFKGHVVSDWDATRIIHAHHRTAPSKADAAAAALNAGLDVELPVTDCFVHLAKLVKSKAVSMKVLDEAVRRVLYAKFWLGLFDDPYCSVDGAKRMADPAEHRQLALEAARQSIVLLKNDGLLPLKRSVKRIAVIGPNAAIGRLGGYSSSGTRTVSPLEGIKAFAPAGVTVTHAEGCGLLDGKREGISKAVALARRADVVVLCLGNSTGESEGEWQDRCDLNLRGAQAELLKAVAAVNQNVVVVLTTGSAVIVSAWLDQTKSLLCAWYAGEEGGTAIAEILFGKTNPSGKLPITWPRTTGQLPLFYNHEPSGRGYDYNDLRGPQYQFPFGFGLSYTQFDYSNLAVKKRQRGHSLDVTLSFDLKNAGKMRGTEVAQLYLHDEYSKRTRPMKELKRFTRVELEPGKKQRVTFRLTAEDFAYLDDDLDPVVEPGDFKLMIGSSCEQIELETSITVK